MEQKSHGSMTRTVKGQERRRYPRVPMQGLEVVVGGERLSVIDINLSGLAFAPGARSCVQGEQLDLTVVSDAHDPIHLSGARVAHCGPGQTGCEFTDPDPATKDALFSIIIKGLSRVMD